MSLKSHTRKTGPNRFKQFAKLPLELQSRIWELACPGPRLIEVYPRPRCRNDYNEVVNYSWRAHQYECEDNCNSPLTISQVCQEARRVFNRVEGEYTKCFGTHINWGRDILYIGDRTGHLHNTESLKAVDLSGGLGKVRNLAIYEDVWAETKTRHGDESREFKRCGPVGVVQQLGVKKLTIVGKASFFRDGTEFHNEVDEREWLYNSDSESQESAQEPGRVEQDSGEDSDEEVPTMAIVGLRGGSAPETRVIRVYFDDDYDSGSYPSYSEPSDDEIEKQEATPERDLTPSDLRSPIGLDANSSKSGSSKVGFGVQLQSRQKMPDRGDGTYQTLRLRGGLASAAARRSAPSTGGATKSNQDGDDSENESERYASESEEAEDDDEGEVEEEEEGNSPVGGSSTSSSSESSSTTHDGSTSGDDPAEDDSDEFEIEQTPINPRGGHLASAAARRSAPSSGGIQYNHDDADDESDERRQMGLRCRRPRRRTPGLQTPLE